MNKKFSLPLAIAAGTSALLLTAWVARRTKKRVGIPENARCDIEQGNQAWIAGMTSGDAKIIAESYCEDGVDVIVNDSIAGREALEKYFAGRMAARGPAARAEVHQDGVVMPGTMIYEWGWAAAEWDDGGKQIRGRYLTVWRRDPDMRWRIYRNIIVD